MQRRRFVQAVSTATAAAEVLAGQQSAPPIAESVKIATVTAESAAEPTTSFFTPRQFTTLKHLGGLLQPAANGRPGAIEAGAAEFLDCLIGASPQPRQQLYRAGLDFVDAESRRLFSKPFPELSAEQADKVVRPPPRTLDI